MATRVVTANDILGGYVGLDLECFDPIYLNGWVPNLQVSGQVANFLTHHLGFPIPSPAILERIGLRFRKAVTEFAAANDIAVVRFARGAEAGGDAPAPGLEPALPLTCQRWPGRAHHRPPGGPISDRPPAGLAYRFR